MFRLPMTPALRFSARHPPAASFPVPGIRTLTPPSQVPSRFFSALRNIYNNANPQFQYTRTFSRPSRCIPPRPFTSFGHRYYRNVNNKYRRFGGQQESFGIRLLRSAKPQHFVIIGGVIGGFYVYNLDTVEVTGRRRFNCISHNQELKMGTESYNGLLNELRGQILPESHPLTIRVNNVLRRLIPLAPLDGAHWKVHVINDDKQMNAFVLPGGKVFVYTGILPFCQDEDGLAAVLGHEIAHVMAHHPAERMSSSIITLGAIFLVSYFFDVSGQLPSVFLNLVYGLPNSRTQEAEADTIGLMMMSKACFNPEAAVEIWARIQKAEKTTHPQFLSTHPSSYNRMEALRGRLHEAQMIYDDGGCHHVGSYLPRFQQARNDFSW